MSGERKQLMKQLRETKERMVLVPTTYGIFCDSEESAKAVTLGWTTLVEELGKQFDVVWRAQPAVKHDEDSGLWMAGMRVAIAPKRFDEPRTIHITTHSYEEEKDIESIRAIEAKLKESYCEQN